MRRYYVQLQNGEGGRGFAIVFEGDYGSVHEIADHLKSGRPVAGTKLSLSRDGEPGPRRVIARTGFAFGFAGLVSVQDWTGTIVEDPR